VYEEEIVLSLKSSNFFAVLCLFFIEQRKRGRGGYGGNGRNNRGLQEEETQADE